jgi:hypothetical protein
MKLQIPFLSENLFQPLFSPSLFFKAPASSINCQIFDYTEYQEGVLIEQCRRNP